MSNRISIGNVSDMPASGTKVFTVNGTAIVVAKVKDGYCAVINKCPHLGLPVAGGKVDADAGTITCPFHNSTFDLCSGQNLDWVQGIVGVKVPEWSRKILALGKEAQPIQRFSVVEENGELFVEM
jgi:nitrite reductase/ring-hydroxylating ferredoxin subunit